MAVVDTCVITLLFSGQSRAVVKVVVCVVLVEVVVSCVVVTVVVDRDIVLPDICKIIITHVKDFESDCCPVRPLAPPTKMRQKQIIHRRNWGVRHVPALDSSGLV